MPRYCVERDLSSDSSALTGGGDVIANNLDDGVTWIHSYVTPDRRRSFCIYDAPTPEAIRRASNRNKLPIKQIFEIRVLEPYSCG